MGACQREVLYRIPGTFACAATLAEDVGRQCALHIASIDKSRAQADMIRLCLAEALNNVIEHAYAGKIGELIEIVLSLTTDKIALTISDHGIPLPMDVIPKNVTQFKPEDLESLPEGGFGWMLIRTEMDNISYRRSENKNILRMEKCVRQA